jgi:hypothetical protein
MVSHSPSPLSTHIVDLYNTGGGVELETMPLNTSWSKFHEKMTNAFASSILYAVQCVLSVLLNSALQSPLDLLHISLPSDT